MFKNAIQIVSISAVLLFAASGSACDPHVGAIDAAAPSAPTEPQASSDADTAPQPSFDVAPITPVETVGASRSE